MNLRGSEGMTWEGVESYKGVSPLGREFVYLYFD